jgi:hypothetical protein
MSKDKPYNAGRVYVYDNNKYPVEIKFAVEGYQTWDDEMWLFEAEDYLAKIVDEDIVSYSLNDYWDYPDAEDSLQAYGRLSL